MSTAVADEIHAPHLVDALGQLHQNTVASTFVIITLWVGRQARKVTEELRRNRAKCLSRSKPTAWDSEADCCRHVNCGNSILRFRAPLGLPSIRGRVFKLAARGADQHPDAQSAAGRLKRLLN